MCLVGQIGISINFVLGPKLRCLEKCAEVVSMIEKSVVRVNKLNKVACKIKYEEMS